MGWREIRCRQCGETVKIPWLWVFGVERVFYCKKCRKFHRINYIAGAVLTGTGWALALVSIQLIARFTSAFTVTLAALLFVPLGFAWSFLLRRTVLRRFGRMKIDK